MRLAVAMQQEERPEEGDEAPRVPGRDLADLLLDRRHEELEERLPFPRTSRRWRVASQLPTPRTTVIATLVAREPVIGTGPSWTRTGSSSVTPVTASSPWRLGGS